MTEYGFGRNLFHDERSRGFPAPTADTVNSVTHRRYIGTLNQGQIGSCTGNAMTGALYTAPFYGKVSKKLPPKTNTTDAEAVAVQLYSEATRLDGDPGSYPGEDTGSTGLAVCKAARNARYISSYTWAFGLDHALAALTLGPVLVGIWWREDMFKPNANGLVTYTGKIVGGHEIEATRIDLKNRLVWFWNSWYNEDGTVWGKNGQFALSFDDLDAALQDDGDVAVPIK